MLESGFGHKYSYSNVQKHPNYVNYQCTAQISMSKYFILIKQLSICGFILHCESSIRYFQGIYQSSIGVLSHKSISD